MTANAIVRGKIVRFRLSPSLAHAHRRNRNRKMTDNQAIQFVEIKRRDRILRTARPYVESHS